LSCLNLLKVINQKDSLFGEGAFKKQKTDNKTKQLRKRKKTTLKQVLSSFTHESV